MEKKTKLNVIKTIITEILGFNSESISNTFQQMGLVFTGALFGGAISMRLSEDPEIFNSIFAWIIALFLMSIFFNFVMRRKRFVELLRQLFK